MNNSVDKVLTYTIHEVAPYITGYISFMHGVPTPLCRHCRIHGCDSCRAYWLTTFPEEERAKAAEAMQLFKEANRMLNQLDENYHVHTIFRLCEANADGDNLILMGNFFLYSASRSHIRMASLSLSYDFVRPLSSGIPDTDEFSLLV